MTSSIFEWADIEYNSRTNCKHDSHIVSVLECDSVAPERISSPVRDRQSPRFVAFGPIMGAKSYLNFGWKPAGRARDEENPRGELESKPDCQ
jgi:hypothetical protein